jgi:hypothetical protein
VTNDFYNITFSNATVTINKLVLTHDVTASNKVYDRTTAASYTGGLLPANVKIDDKVMIDGGFRLVFTDPNVGDDIAVVPQNPDFWTLAGADGDNYVFPPWDDTQPWAKADITPKPIGDSDINAAGAPQTYTGSTCTTTVVVAFGAATLTKDVDYTIYSYSNNINAGQATVTIKGAGNYDPATTRDIPFTIAPMTIAVEELTAQDKTYDGTTAATLTIDEATIKNKLFADDRAGITVNYPTAGNFNQADVDKNIQVTPSAAVTLNGGNAANYLLIQQTGLKADINPKSVTSTDISVAPVVPLTYTGSSITPALTIHDGTTLLIENSDYTVSYRENVDIGPATATIRGMGNYSNTETTSTSFTIVQKAITVAELTAQDKMYDGTTAATLTFNETVFKNKLASVDRAVITITPPTSGTFAQSDVGTDIAVTAADVVLSGMKASNYDVTQQTGLKADITQRLLTDADLTIAPVSAHTYTGAAIEPPLTVTEGVNTLTPLQDYTVNYDDNIDAGTASATVTITGTGNYSGNASTTTTFTIQPKDINEANIAAIPDQTYTGATITPRVTVTDGGALAENTDYTLSYNNNLNAGQATVTITGKGNYTSSQSVSFTIQQKPLTAADLTIAPVSAHTYTGVAIEPPLTVTEGVNTLTFVQDYTVNYADNIDAGTASATVTITSIGNYTGGAFKATTFTIAPRNINEAIIAPIADQTYAGATITPPLTVTYGINSLTKGTNYTVEYSNNINVGTATVTITGTGNYTATQQTSFNIIRKSIAGSDITIVPVSAQTYTGSALTPSVIVLDGTATLTKSTDYTVAYTNNVNVGTATVMVTGKGNYDGVTDVTFEIVKADQTIHFPDIPDLWLINGPYTLQATATSGLPITYTSSHPNIADIGNDGITLQLKQFGAATITASQPGNNNYNPAAPVQRQVVIEESGITGVLRVIVIGADFDAINSRYVMRCSENSVIVIVEPEDYTARVYYNNILGSTFAVEVPTGVHSITYKVASGANVHEYTLEIAKPFKFDDVVKMRWNNTLTVINNPDNNGGFHFTSFAWYGDGRLITNNQSFSAGNIGQNLDPTITYHVVLAAEEYIGTLNSCPSVVTLRQNEIDMMAYPNPVQSNSCIFVEINMDEKQLDHAEIEIFNIVGASMGKVRVAGPITSVDMSSLPTGIYLLNLRGKNDLNKIVKVVVQ